MSQSIKAFEHFNVRPYLALMHLQVVATRIHRMVQHPFVWVSALIAVAVFAWNELHHRNDLDLFLAASTDLFSGKPIYTTLYFDCYYYFYSTFFATLVHPLTLFPPWAAKLLWISLNIWLCWRIWELSIGFLRAPWFRESLQTLFGLILLLLSLRFLRANLHFGQLTIILLWASLESVSLIRSGKFALGGMLLAVAINIKLLPLALWPWLWWRREWKALAVSVTTWLVLLVLPALWLGPEKQLGMMVDWWHLINPLQERHVLDTEETSFHGLTNVIPVFTLAENPESRALAVPRNIFSLEESTVKTLVHLSRLSVILFTLWFVGWRPFRRMGQASRTFYEVSYILLAVPLVFPHQQSYAFLLAMPAFAWIIYVWIERVILVGKRPSWYEWTALSIVALTFNLALWLGIYAAWYNHFKVLTFGTLILAGMLAFYKPKQGSSTSEKFVS